jgi:hypothetical protein
VQTNRSGIPHAATIVANSAAVVVAGASAASLFASQAAAVTGPATAPGTTAGAAVGAVAVGNAPAHAGAALESAGTDMSTVGSALGRLRIEAAQDTKLNRSGWRNAVSVDANLFTDDMAHTTQARIDAVETAQATGLALTAGTVWWALRAGGLMASLAVSLPAWRHADLLAVLPDEDDADWDLGEDDEAARDEEALRQMLAPIAEGEYR